MIFDLAMNFLVAWINNLVRVGFYRLPAIEIKPCLLYADDTLFFLKPTQANARRLDIILKLFQQVSGLTINMQKSEVLIVNGTEYLTRRMAAW